MWTGFPPRRSLYAARAHASAWIRRDVGKSTTPNTPQLAGAALDVCLPPTKPASNSIPLTRVRPSGEPNVLLRAVIGGSKLTSVGQKADSIPIEHGPASSKSSYRKCSGVRHSVTPKHFGAGAFPIKPKDFSVLIRNSTSHRRRRRSQILPNPSPRNRSKPPFHGKPFCDRNWYVSAVGHPCHRLAEDRHWRFAIYMEELAGERPPSAAFGGARRSW